MLNSWERTITDVQRILGPSARIPEKVHRLVKALQDQESTWADFDRLKDSLNKKVDDIKRMTSILHADEQAAQLENHYSNFGLNPKTDKTKIDQAHIMLGKFFVECQANVYGLGDLDYIKSAMAKLGKGSRPGRIKEDALP